MLKVFLSSSFRDLINERTAVQSVISRVSAHYIGMEYFGSFPETPKERCLKQVRLSNVFVLVLGTRYGHAPEESCSITEEEYRLAVSLSIPVLVYFAGYITYNKNEPESEKRNRFHDEIKDKFGVTWFHSPDDLAWKVACDLAREFGSHLEQQNKTFSDGVKNAILIDPIHDDIDRLIERLQARSRQILVKYLAKAMASGKSEIAPLLMEFDELHKKHVTALQERRILDAHDILIEIHRVSFEIELKLQPSPKKDIFPEIMYSKNIDLSKLKLKTNTGNTLAHDYIGKETGIGYSTYAMSKIPSGKRSQVGIFNYFPDVEKPSPSCTIKLYKNILDEN